MAYPSKGDRQQVSTRISRSYYEKMNEYVEAIGITKNDFIHDLIVDRLEEIDVAALHPDQEELPLTA